MRLRLFFVVGSGSGSGDINGVHVRVCLGVWGGRPLFLRCFWFPGCVRVFGKAQEAEEIRSFCFAIGTHGLIVNPPPPHLTPLKCHLEVFLLTGWYPSALLCFSSYVCVTY